MQRDTASRSSSGLLSSLSGNVWNLAMTRIVVGVAMKSYEAAFLPHAIFFLGAVHIYIGHTEVRTCVL
jgi:hypothetical protein